MPPKPLKEKIIQIAEEDTDPIMDCVMDFVGRIQYNHKGPLIKLANQFSKKEGGLFVLGTFDSNKFVSTDLVVANRVRGVNVVVGVPRKDKDSYYDSTNHTVFILLPGVFWVYLTYVHSKPQESPKPFSDWFKQLEFNMDVAKDRMLGSMFNYLTYEKNIHHELSHWYRDMTGGQYLSKMLYVLNNIEPRSKNRPKKKINQPRIFTHFEIDAQAHTVALLKRLTEAKNPGSWDDWDFSDIFRIFSDDLGGYVRGYQDKSPKEVQDWLIRLWMRCRREGILGKRMQKLNIDKVLHVASESWLIRPFTESDFCRGSYRSKWWDGSAGRIY